MLDEKRWRPSASVRAVCCRARLGRNRQIAVDGVSMKPLKSRMNRNSSFCFPEDPLGPNDFIVYLRFSKSWGFFSLAMSLVATGFIDACIEDNEKLHFSSSLKATT